MLDNLRNSFEEKRTLWLIGGVALFLIIAVISLVILNSGSKIKIAPPVKVTLTWWQAGDIRADQYSEIISNFQKIPGNSGVDIQIQDKNIADQYYYNLLADYARDIAPDIFTLKNDDLPAYKEYLSPIENIKGKALVDYQQNYVNQAIKDTMSKDKVFGVTSYVDNLQLFYNKKLLDQNSITRPPSSWSELTRQVPQITKKALSNDTFLTSTIAFGTGGRTPEGSPNIENHYDILPMLIFQSGANIYDTQNSSVVFGSDKNSGPKNAFENGNSMNNSEKDKSSTLKAMQFYLDFSESSTQNYTWNRNSPKSIDAFTQGNLAYIVQYKSFSDTVKKLNNRLDYDITPIPQLNESNQVTFGQFYMNVLNRKLSSDQANKIKYQKAQELMQYMTTKEAQQILADKTGLPSANRDVNANQQQGDQTTRTFAKGALIANSYYKPDVDATQKIWSDMFERVQYRNVSLEKSLEESISDYKRLVNLGPRIRR